MLQTQKSAQKLLSAIGKGLAMNRALKTETNLHNLRSGPILAVLINWARLCLIRPDFGRNADWLLEQCHKIWLAVGNAGSWKRLFLAWLFSWMIRRRRREGSNLLSFLLFYGLMVGKHCAMEIQKIHMVVHIFSGFALFTELMWVYSGVESLCKVPFDLPTNECKSKCCPS